MRDTLSARIVRFLRDFCFVSFFCVVRRFVPCLDRLKSVRTDGILLFKRLARNQENSKTYVKLNQADF